MDNKDKLLSYILETLDLSELPTTSRDSLQNVIKTFTVTTSRFWKKCSLNIIRFRNQNAKWLDQIVITSGGQETGPSTSTSREAGRPKKSFCDLFTKTKRRRLNIEVKSKSKEEICLAASMKLHSEGNRSALVLDISTSPVIGQIAKEAGKSQDNCISYSCQEALSLMRKTLLHFILNCWYRWYPMTPTVHKVLIHGKDIIDNFLLPVGMLGEDAQESRHKDVRYYREHNTRKMTRNQTNEDLMKILLISSDPVISNIRILPIKQKHIMLIEVLNLLQEPEVVLDEE